MDRFTVWLISVLDPPPCEHPARNSSPQANTTASVPLSNMRGIVSVVPGNRFAFSELLDESGQLRPGPAPGQRTHPPHPSQEPLPTHPRRAPVRDLLHQVHDRL